MSSTKTATKPPAVAGAKGAVAKPAKKNRPLTLLEKSLFVVFAAVVIGIAIHDYNIEYKLAERKPAPPGYHYAEWMDLSWVVLFVVLITLIRYYVLDKFVFIPLCSFVPKQNEHIKFRESAFKLVTYSAALAFGIYAVHDEIYIHDFDHVWIDFPSHPVRYLTGVYYLVELAYNIHMLITVFTDVRRKDFAEYIIHHFTTVFLILFSYILACTRIGVLVLLAHDPSDVILELAKCSKYFGYKRVPDVLFGVFVLSWIVFRLYGYSYVIAYDIYKRSFTLANAVPYTPMNYFFGTMLWTLVALHYYWFYLIVRMVIRLFQAGTTEKDIRSDDSDDEGDSKKED
eukprot:TRINITY_DN1508_c0_g1_i1.p1 TRINITY_DN1508_c0_g1~~TRINITY_DN1508_c0_g1_i1.p1  ORF type:complete len:342 (+),score=85.18 TRINITY_DN1508_c0_g1_i1:75-1100(+)